MWFLWTVLSHWNCRTLSPAALMMSQAGHNSTGSSWTSQSPRSCCLLPVGALISSRSYLSELALTKSRQPLSSLTSAFTSTLMSLWGHMSPRPSLSALPYCISYETFADPSPDPFSSRWYHYSFCHDWITEMQPLPVFRCTSSSVSSR